MMPDANLYNEVFRFGLPSFPATFVDESNFYRSSMFSLGLVEPNEERVDDVAGYFPGLKVLWSSGKYF
jgi:hypothetical protein